MKVLRQLQELCIALIVIHTGAEITLNVVTPLDTLPIHGTGVEVDFECGSRVIFVCEIKPYIDTADWQVNSKTYALCLFQNCFFYPPYPADHNLSMSLATETFNLTTDPITLAAERNIYSCSNGLTPLSVDANVKVYVKNETLEMDTSTASQITLTTGCVYPYGMDNLTFEWFISKDRVFLQKSQFVRDEVQSITAFTCAETSYCAGAASVQFNSTMVVEIFDTGDDYHICAAVQHIDKPDRPHAVHCSVKTYKVRNYITDGSAKTLAYWIMLLIILSIPRILFLQTFFFLQCEVDRSNACICLTGFFLPGQGLVLLLNCKTGVCCCNIKKWFFVFLSSAIDIAIIVVYLVLEQLTQWRIYLPVAIFYICVYLIVNATIVKCIYARYRCKKCANKSDYVCKSCKLIYCNDCVKQDPEMICVCIKCTKCERKSVFICKLCNKKYCKDCMSQDGCITEQQMTCGSCEEAQIEMKSYCCKCKKFLCNDCSKDHKCNGILLKHPQHGTEREEDTFCEKEHTTRNSACGYCVKCDCYLCFTCLKSHAEQQLILIQRHSDAVKDRLCCSRGHAYHEKSYPAYCLTCKLYICLNCSEKHRGDEHHLIMHILEESCFNSDTDKENCAKHADKHAECYSYTEDACLCADCFEQGHKPKHQDYDLSAKMKIFKTACYLHKHFDEKCFKTEAYCLICKKCFCRRCYKLHRRFTEHWIQTHDRKTYLCKMCQKQENCFPVECVDLGSFTISCAECFERKDKAETESSEDYYKLAEVQRRNLLKKNLCQIHEIPFSDQEDKVKSNVYCFICKAYMCNICYKNHRRLGSVWLKNEKWKHWNRLSFNGFERTATGSKWIICTLIPVFGFIYGIVQLCRHKHSDKVGQGGNE